MLPVSVFYCFYLIEFVNIVASNWLFSIQQYLKNVHTNQRIFWDTFRTLSITNCFGFRPQKTLIKSDNRLLSLKENYSFWHSELPKLHIAAHKNSSWYKCQLETHHVLGICKFQLVVFFSYSQFTFHFTHVKHIQLTFSSD